MWIIVNGQTYEVRQVLKRLGARWDYVRRVWIAGQASPFGASLTPVPSDRPTVERIRDALDRGMLPGCWLELWCPTGAIWDGARQRRIVYTGRKEGMEDE